MHPAVCSKLFGARKNMTPMERKRAEEMSSLAIGMIGSSDIVNNLLIAFFSRSILDHVGYDKYFMLLSVFVLVVLVVTCFFPDIDDEDEISLDESKVCSTLASSLRSSSISIKIDGDFDGKDVESGLGSSGSATPTVPESPGLTLKAHDSLFDGLDISVFNPKSKDGESRIRSGIVRETVVTEDALITRL